MSERREVAMLWALKLERRPQARECRWTLLLLLLSCFSRVRLCDSIDGSPPGSFIPGILQARILEWVAISFSNAWKWRVKVKSLSRVQLLAAPWTAAYQALPPMGFSRQEYWSGSPLPSPRWTLDWKMQGNGFSSSISKMNTGLLPHFRLLTSEVEDNTFVLL